MITALVQFKLPRQFTREEAGRIFSGTAPKYRELDGLIRKYYLLSEDGNTAGGVYLWNSRTQAEKLYNDEWSDFIYEKYGTRPTVTYFETPVVVDNEMDKIITEK